MSKKRRYAVLAVAVLVCVLVAFGVLALLPAGPGVNKTNFDQIEVGTGISNVEQLFDARGQAFHGFADRDPTMYWQSEDGSLAFVEVVDDAVKTKTWQQSRETLWQKLRRWLRI